MCLLTPQCLEFRIVADIWRHIDDDLQLRSFVILRLKCYRSATPLTHRSSPYDILFKGSQYLCTVVSSHQPDNVASSDQVVERGQFIEEETQQCRNDLSMSQLKLALDAPAMLL